MKKLITLLVAAMLSCASLCLASNGSEMDAEEAATKAFFTNYVGASSYEIFMSAVPEPMRQGFTQEMFQQGKNNIAKDIGTVSDLELDTYVHFPDGSHRIVLRGKTTKAPNLALVIAVFQKVAGKYQMVQFQVMPLPVPAKQDAQKKAQEE